VIQHETSEKIVEIAGTFTKTTPAQWASRRDVTVDMTLGYGERDKRVEELLQFDKFMSEKRTRLYGEPQSYEVIKEALEIKGLKNISRFLVDPKTLGPAEPDPKIMAEVDKLKKDTEVAERQMALRERQVTDEINRNQAEFTRKAQESAEDLKLRQAEQARKQAETDNRIDIGLAELDLLIHESLNAPEENQKFTGIASPNS
jgi:hypothetical protein